MKPVNVYREMFRQDVSSPQPATNDQILATFETYWKKADEDYSEDVWPKEQRASRKLWAGLGFLVFGFTDYLEETLKIIQTYPLSVNSRAARHYVSAIKRLLPLPGDLFPTKSSQETLRWLNSTKHALKWNEEEGLFLYEK